MDKKQLDNFYTLKSDGWEIRLSNDRLIATNIAALQPLQALPGILGFGQAGIGVFLEFEESLELIVGQKRE